MGGDMCGSELDWLLKVDVRTNLEHLHQILTECAATICNTKQASYNLFYCSQNQLDTVRVNANLDGYKITSADINIKLSSKHPMQTIKTCIKETPSNPFCWRLYQIQDAINHLNLAIDLLHASPLNFNSPQPAPVTQTPVPTDSNKQDDLEQPPASPSSPPSPLPPTPTPPSLLPAPYESADEVLQLLHGLMGSLQKSRSSLTIPKKSSVEELQHCQNMQSISPSLPLDYSISFYVHANNLVCSVYHLAQINNRAQVKNEYQAEVPIPYLADVLILLSLGLQVCQQLNDKIRTLQDGV